MRIGSRRKRLQWSAGVALVITLVVAIGWVQIRSGSGEASTADTPAPPPAVPASVTISPTPQATGINPLTDVRVSADFGRLDDVRLVDDTGEAVRGSVGSDSRTWTANAPLEYGRTYTMTVSSRGPTGIPATQTSSFTTLTPREQTGVTFTTTSGAALSDGGTYGVGTVVVARFDEPVPDRAAAEERLSVTTAPAVEGSWYWMDDRRAHWRPKDYYRPGTEITARAEVFGAHLGDGLYGEQNSHASFRIGDSRVSVADDTTKQISVYENGELVRTIPTSMGMGGSETIGGKTISFWTQPGVYTVMGKANPVVMDSSTYGLPVDSPEGYRTTVNYAVRLTSSGIYVHELESTVWAQGNTNVSHGCLNVNADHARWFYEFSQPGDVFEVRNTDGDPLPIWQNGDWSVSWDEWLAGSALQR
ncbi:Ig-like domain-containing protein [Mycolicibacterium elephantis]|uniref:L,D-transpeptidase n=1 Tax=Mycolicibacterium elephantis TaxID=81858 RepID=UPI0009ED303C|nr:Ig-like domain-containing protein [Mycolicibacterium elephantis]